MLYFNSLPKIFNLDENGSVLVLTNILTRAKLIEELQNNPMLFYKYSVQDGDTPEIVASKYYDDPNKFWLITYSNQIMDPLWDWPLTYQQFIDYINSKYENDAELAGKTPFNYVNETVYDYQKVTTTTDSETGLTTEKSNSIDFETYSSLIETTNTYTLPNGHTCKISVSKKLVTIFDYEYNLNEEKRIIKLLNESYAGQMEQAFVELMRR